MSFLPPLRSWRGLGLLVAAGFLTSAAYNTLSARFAEVKPYDPPELRGRDGQAIELGTVAWHRDFDKAAEIAAKTGKPLFVLFVEIPGCRVTLGMGVNIFNDMLIKEAIETEFVPVAIFNSAPERTLDHKTLVRLGEAAWNLPVIRFVTASGEDVIPRAESIHTAYDITTRMMDALRAMGKPVPNYLKLAQEEGEQAQFCHHAIYGVPCFWSAQEEIMQIPGVIHTQPAYINESEVVVVTYSSRHGLTLPTLTKQVFEIPNMRVSGIYPFSEEAAQQAREVCDLRFGNRWQSHIEIRVVSKRRDVNPAEPSDYARQLKQWGRASNAKLSPMQESRINADIALGRDPTVWLSPSQLSALTPAPIQS